MWQDEAIGERREWRRRSDGVVDLVAVVVAVAVGWRRVSWLMVARMVWSWWSRWSGIGGGVGGVVGLEGGREVVERERILVATMAKKRSMLRPIVKPISWIFLIFFVLVSQLSL